VPRKPLDPAVYTELTHEIARDTADPTLHEPERFAAREDAWRLVERRVMRRIEALLQNADKGERKQLRAIKRQGHALRTTYDEINEQLFATFRARVGTYTPQAVMEQWASYVEPVRREEWSDPPRYDHLDTFLDGVLRLMLSPRPQRQADTEMIYYQATPARIVLDMVRRLDLGPHDVFYDLGSGLGRVAIAVALLSPARVVGVEYEPAYVEWSRRHAEELGLHRVTFVTADARDVRYDDGTVFFLYTPFKGKILQRVIDLLRYEGRRRPIRICTYGPGTFDILKEGGFRPMDPPDPTVHRVTILVVDDDAPPRSEPPTERR
jgi:hypothetical protein